MRLELLWRKAGEAPFFQKSVTSVTDFRQLKKL